jgi:DNA-binding MarR family transcriptional regulator
MGDNGEDPRDSQASPDPAAIWRLLKRRELAATRVRSALGRELGLSDQEMLVLAYLEDHGELTPSRLGKLLDLSSGGITALLQRLERDGHVTREAHPTDRRSCVIRPTPKAARRGTEAVAPVVEEIESLLGSLGAEDRRTIHEFLRHVTSVTEEQASRLWHEHGDTGDRPLRAVPSLWA